MTRREFLIGSSALAASTTLTSACTLSTDATATQGSRLKARPVPGVKTTAAGTSPLGLDAARDAVLRIPGKAAAPLPLLIMLHGAGGRAARFLQRFESEAEEARIALLVPDSRGSTWDAIRPGAFGPDVAFLDRALERVFARVAIDPERIAVGGFSDGATYALSLGLINGDLFRRIVAFSPGFLIDGPPNGKPRCFISHGVRDDILPIDRCSRRIVPLLRRREYEVDFREFDGGHEVPAKMVTDAFALVRS